MTRYECLDCKIKYCVTKAIYLLKVKHDPILSEFYRRAAIGFKKKQRVLSLEQAAEKIG